MQETDARGDKVGDKKALKTDRYQLIFNAFKPSQELKPKAKVIFL